MALGLPLPTPVPALSATSDTALAVLAPMRAEADPGFEKGGGAGGSGASFDAYLGQFGGLFK